MKETFSRRQFLLTSAIAGAGLALPRGAFGSGKKSVLVFTKSSGFEHTVVKKTDAGPSIVDQAVTTIGAQHGFDVTSSKDGRIFDSKDFRKKYAAVFFFTTGDLTKAGTDGNPPMSAQGKQALLDAVHGGLGFVGVHAASDTFHTEPDTEDRANRYIAHGDQSDPYLRMLGGEFITHGSTPRLQTADLIVKDAKFPGLEGVTSPVSFTEEWYSLKDFAPDLHVILALDTQGMKGAAYQRARPENWSIPFFLNHLAGGIGWTIGNAKASVDKNLAQATPGYAEIPPKG